jgi:uncharacterized membrane protein
MSQSAHLRSKEPATALAGPYGHPFHAIAVTIPIGAWSASIVFDIIGLVSDYPGVYAAGSRILILIGLVGAVLAAILGLVDLSRLEKKTPARRVALTHMTINLCAMVVWIVSLAIRQSQSDAIPVVAFVLSLAAFAGLGVSGWLGGKLAYRYGVRVARETTQAEGFVGADTHG